MSGGENTPDPLGPVSQLALCVLQPSGQRPFGWTVAILAASDGGGDDAAQGCWMLGCCLICMGLPNYSPSRSNDVASSLAAQKAWKRGPPSNMQPQTRMGSEGKPTPGQINQPPLPTPLHRPNGAHLHAGVMFMRGSAYVAAAETNRRRQ